MKNIILTIVFLCFSLSSFVAKAVFSDFKSINPKNMKDLEATVNLIVNKDDKNYFDVKIEGVTYKDVWLITVDKVLNKLEQQEFRNYIWKKEFKPAKVLKLQKLFTNRSKNKNPAFPAFIIKKDFGENSYIYMDHPKESADGGYFYAIDLPKFYENQIAAPLRQKETDALKAAEKERKESGSK